MLPLVSSAPTEVLISSAKGRKTSRVRLGPEDRFLEIDTQRRDEARWRYHVEGSTQTIRVPLTRFHGEDQWRSTGEYREIDDLFNATRARCSHENPNISSNEMDLVFAKYSDGTWSRPFFCISSREGKGATARSATKIKAESSQKKNKKRTASYIETTNKKARVDDEEELEHQHQQHQQQQQPERFVEPGHTPDIKDVEKLLSDVLNHREFHLASTPHREFQLPAHSPAAPLGEMRMEQTPEDLIVPSNLVTHVHHPPPAAAGGVFGSLAAIFGRASTTSPPPSPIPDVPLNLDEIYADFRWSPASPEQLSDDVLFRVLN